MTLTLSMSVRRTLLGIELCCGCGARKGGQAQATLMYAHDGRIRIERALQPLRIGDLRHQAAIGQRRGFAVAIAAGVRTAGERALEGLQTLPYPMTGPALALRLIELELGFQIAQNAQIVERMDVAGDAERQREHACARRRTGGQQAGS